MGSKMTPPTGRTMPSDAIVIVTSSKPARLSPGEFHPICKSTTRQSKKAPRAGGAAVPPRAVANLHLLAPHHPQSRCRSPPPIRLMLPTATAGGLARPLGVPAHHHDEIPSTTAAARLRCHHLRRARTAKMASCCQPRHHDVVGARSPTSATPPPSTASLHFRCRRPQASTQPVRHHTRADASWPMAHIAARPQSRPAQPPPRTRRGSTVARTPASRGRMAATEAPTASIPRSSHLQHHPCRLTATSSTTPCRHRTTSLQHHLLGPRPRLHVPTQSSAAPTQQLPPAQIHDHSCRIRSRRHRIRPRRCRSSPTHCGILRRRTAAPASRLQRRLGDEERKRGPAAALGASAGAAQRGGDAGERAA
ncbi:hypothetical protein PVAP13_6NG232700 [Panicum virgatum]|uniref:Uncharacterized protein n=1 Tax=Panicum virgatum TaxID=38727 RepID=A0A8T0QWI4_PANVG|nr:hypothetical protein PVAP13_6NG232700 [Panicum virgatum]